MKHLMATLMIGLLAVVPLSHPRAKSPETNPRVEIGWTAWDDAEVVSKLAALLIKDAMKRDVELTLADISMQYRALDNGQLDAMLMSWQPLTHETYLRRYDDLVSAGVLYDGAKLGLAVPSYIPEETVSSVADLAKPEVREKMQRRIIGIDPNAGLMSMAREAIPTYGLDNYRLVEGTGPSMTKALAAAVAQEQWIVVTAWTPHWLFGAHDMRFLTDPQKSFGGTEQVHAMVRPDLQADDPELFAFLSRMHFDLPDLQNLMADVQESGDREALIRWIRDHRDTIARWLNHTR